MLQGSITSVGRPIGRGLLYLLLGVVALFALFPLYWLVISAFKPPSEFALSPPTLWPMEPTAAPFARALTLVPFAQSMLNSFIIASVCTLSALATSTMAAYVFAKYDFKGKMPLFWGLVSTMFLPPVVTLVPLYHIVSGLGLSDSFLGVMLPWLANPFGILLIRQFLLDFPDELIEAARIDGASEYRIVWTVVVPLLRPALVTLGVFCFVYYWNTFIWPLSVFSSTDKYPITLSLNGLMSFNTSVEYRNVVLAGALLASLPTLTVFYLAQRVFVQGIARSGIK